MKKDLEEKIKDIVKSLPEKLKSVFILSEYQEFSCREIANILEIPIFYKKLDGFELYCETGSTAPW